MIGFAKKNYVYIVMFICFAFLLWRAFQGFCWTDEAFYVSTADRFYRGCTPLVGEWFRTQLSSVVMLPFYSLYILITGSNAGVILYFRILYLILSTTTAVVCYRVLSRDYPRFVGGAAALFVMCYAHLNNATFSYYMLSFDFLLLGLMLIYDHRHSGKKSRLFIAGMFIALAVLCMPAFAVGFAIVILLVVMLMIIIKLLPDLKPLNDWFSPSRAGEVINYVIAGMAIPAAVFAVWLLTRQQAGDIFSTLPYALTDNEHTNTLGYYIRKPHRCLVQVFGVYTYFSYVLIAVSFVFGKYLAKKPLCHIVVIVDTILFALMAYDAYGHTGYIQVAFFLFVIPVYFVSDRRNTFLFWLFIIPSVLVSVIYCFTSSDFLYVMAIGAALSSGVGVSFVYDYYAGNIKENYQNRSLLARSVSYIIILVCLFTVAVTFILRMKNVYRDAPVERLTEPISAGVAKGLFTTEEHLMMYNDVMDAINEHCMDTDGNVLFSKILPWGYAQSGLDCGYPTTWRSTAYNDEQLDVYYSVNPGSRPDVIMVLDEQYGSYDAAGDVEDDHNPNLDEMSDYWKDYIRQNHMTETKVKCGRVYTKIK